MKHPLIVGMLLAIALAQSGYATDITVTTTDDEVDGTTSSIANLLSEPGGDGISLREAVIAVNNTAAGAPHRILLPAGTFQLTIDGTGESYPANEAAGDLDFTRSGTTLEGAGAALSVIQQTRSNDRVIEVNPNLDPGFTFTLTQVTVRGGRETTAIGGGGMISGSSGNQATVTDCIFVDNQVSGLGTPVGGAIAHAGGDLTVNNCSFANNSAVGGGGAILFDAGTSGGSGTLTLNASTFNANTSSSSSGGALKTTGLGAAYVVTGCTFTGNLAQGANARGGAICHESGSLTVTLCTLLNNQVAHASGAGGAIGSADGSGNNVTISYCRLLGNSATTPANGLSLYGGSGSTMTANDNWWGVNSGPPANHVINATATLWLRLTHTANPAAIKVGDPATLTASFLSDSGGNPISPANLATLIGLPITFNNAVRGTLSAAQTTIQSSGTATATFTATSSGSGSADASVDAQTVTAAVTVSANAAPTAVADAIQRFAKEGVKVGVATLLANDTDPDSDPLTITAVSPTSPNGASIYLAPPWVHYVPASGFTGSDTFSYTISDGHGGTAIGTVTVTIKTDNSPSGNQVGSVQPLVPSGYRVTFAGIPGRTYTIQYTGNLSPPISWNTLGTATASTLGAITFDDNPGAPARFYRTVYP